MRSRDIAVVVGAILLAILLFALVGGGRMMGPGMMGWGGYGLGGRGILMLLFWALVIGGVVLLILWLVQRGGPAPMGSGPGAARPLDILKERYAKGEITREQYEQMRQDLEER